MDSRALKLWETVDKKKPLHYEWQPNIHIDRIDLYSFGFKICTFLEVEIMCMSSPENFTLFTEITATGSKNLRGIVY